jgi:hypothetical protein
MSAADKRSRALRILVVTESLPFPPRNGVELPVAKFIEAFGDAFECDLLVTSSATGEAGFHARLAAVPESVREVFWLLSENRSAIRQIVEELTAYRPAYYRTGFDRRATTETLGGRVYDWLWVSPVGCMGFVECVRRWGLLREARVGIGLNDVTTSLYLATAREVLTGRIGFAPRRAMRLLRLPWVYHFERTLLSESDLVHVQNDLEKRRAASVLGGRVNQVQVVAAQNGRDERMSSVVPAGPGSHDMLYMTALQGGRANESRWFLDKVWPQIRDRDLKAVLHLAGTPPAPDSDFYARDLERVVVHGFVDDLLPLYSSARIAVLPMSFCTGLINRLLDALTAGLPLVATPQPLQTVEGLVPGVHALSASSPDEFAEAVVRLLSDSELWDKLRRASRQLALEQPTWEESAAKVLSVIKSSVSNQ